MPVSFTPYNKVELVACFHDIDRRLKVEVKPAAAEALRPYEVPTVKDVLRLTAWPYPHLRILIERRLPSIKGSHRAGVAPFGAQAGSVLRGQKKIDALLINAAK
jgi:hypothetical protein